MIIRIIRIIIINSVLSLYAIAAQFTDVTANNFLIRDATAWNEIEHGFTERWALIYPYSMGTNMYSQPGQGLQYSRPGYYNAWLATKLLQDNVSNMVYHGWYIGTNMPLAIETLATYTNFIQFSASAGLSSNGWRRATTYIRETDDWTDVEDPMWRRPENGYGTARQGDIIGPWLIDDLQRALARMDILDGSFLLKWNSGGITNGAYTGSAYDQSTWAGARDSAIEEYPGTPRGVTFNAPYSHFRGSRITSTRYGASIYANFNRLLWNIGYYPFTLSTIQGRGAEIGYYALAVAVGTFEHSSVFNDNGTGLIESHYTRFDVGSITVGDTNSYYTSAWLNDGIVDSAPPPCAEPDATTPKTETGFKITGQKILIRLNWSHTR